MRKNNFVALKARAGAVMVSSFLRLYNFSDMNESAEYLPGPAIRSSK